LLIPLIALGTIGIRYALFAYAARLAASAGSQCSTFLVDANPPKDLSAVNVATQVANQTANAFSGIKLTNVACYIVSAPLAGGSATRQSAPLANPADTSSYSYNFEVALQGQLNPLVYSKYSGFISIPGLGAPIATTARASVFFESTQGLNQ
jgi:hypothetical protein